MDAWLRLSPQPYSLCSSPHHSRKPHAGTGGGNGKPKPCQQQDRERSARKDRLLSSRKTKDKGSFANTLREQKIRSPGQISCMKSVRYEDCGALLPVQIKDPEKSVGGCLQTQEECVWGEGRDDNELC